MPTRPVSADNMDGGGKHWTKAELEARHAAADGSKRQKRVVLKPPPLVKEKPEVYAVWKDIVKKLRGIELLDNLDSDLLAVYCDALVHYRECSRRIGLPVHREDGEAVSPMAMSDLIKETQAWARIVAQFADKLGLTPGGRARWAKKQADKKLDPFEEAFGG
ncbi:MAG: phage terminase small subunit P27 family [Anaerolineae bacterium]|nr:phage terminase small subunit P27 family [Anaerolineae bacterium]